MLAMVVPPCLSPLHVLLRARAVVNFFQTNGGFSFSQFYFREPLNGASSGALASFLIARL